MHMVCSTLEETWDHNPNDSIVMWMRLNISPPEEYSGCSDLEAYKTFVTGILQWLRLHGLLGVNYTETQVKFLGTQLKGNISKWFTRNVEHPGWPIKDFDWSLESVIEGLQKRFLIFLMHRQVSNKFDTIKQWQKTVQELIQELTKYATWIVQYQDNYSFRRWLIAALRPSLQKEVSCRGITVQFNGLQYILEKAKDMEDSLWYDIRSQMSVEMMGSNAYVNNAMAKSFKQMIGAVPKGTVGQTMMHRQSSKPIQNTSSNTCKIPDTSSKQPLKEGEPTCCECGQKGHMQPQCPKLRKRCIAAVSEDDSEKIVEANEENLERDAKDDASEEEEIPLKEEENLNKVQMKTKRSTCGMKLSTNQTTFSLLVMRQLLNSSYE